MRTQQRSTRGETLVEALVSILIAALVFTFLTNAVVTAARVNAAIRNEDISLDLDDAGSIEETNASVLINNDASNTVDVKLYTIKKDGEVLYRYYEYAE